MINKEKYDDFILIDNRGKIAFADFSNPRHLGLDQEELKGKNIRDIFENLPEDYPTLLAATKGIPGENATITVTSINGKKIKKSIITYPVYGDDKVQGAIEFSKIHYGRENVRELESLADFPIYRNNNTKYKISSIVTADPTMMEIKKKVEKYAIKDSSVLIYGETGTGKELIAQALHNSSRRYYNKFISVNCGALPNNIMEGLIFGTTKGSFTGAEDKPGLFEQAEGGTLFLDEINSLDPMLQIKILKAVESKTVRRIGSTKEKKVDVRIVAATNEEPHELMEKGKLNKDLFYRLAVIYVVLPPLRDRGDDVNLITDHFVVYFNKNMNLSIEPISQEIRDIFVSYNWPGNVRELRNVIEGAFAFAENNKITLNEIPGYILKECKNNQKQGARRISEGSDTLASKIDSVETALIKEALSRSDGNLTKAANLLGISKQLLRYKLNKEEK